MIYANINQAPNTQVFHKRLGEYPTITINGEQYKPYTVFMHPNETFNLDYMNASHKVITFRHRDKQNEPVTENLFRHIEGFYPLHFIDFRRLQEPISIQLQTTLHKEE